jgi:CBS domain-containing protein
MTVKAILSQKGAGVVTVSPTVSLRNAIMLLDEHKIGSVIITNSDQQVIGILTERDVFRILARKVRNEGACQICDEPVGEAMTREVETCTQADTVHQIMQRMTASRFRHLPVIEEGRLVGIISIGDLVKHRLQQMEFESEALHQYISAA